MPGWPPPDKLGERYAIPQPPPAAVAAWPHPHQVPLGAPPIGPRRGKQCQLCRREFASLWRIVIRTPNGFEERFVCGDPAGCALTSAAPPLQV